jgi:hypothetical protein
MASSAAHRGGRRRLVVNGDRIRVLAERNPANLPWKELGVDVVLECTGLVHQQGKGRGPPAGWRQKGDHLGAQAARTWMRPSFMA